MQKINFASFKNYKKLRTILLDERQQWFLWVPVLYGVGILIYLALPFEPNLFVVIFAAVAVLFAAIFFHKYRLVFRHCDEGTLNLFQGTPKKQSSVSSKGRWIAASRSQEVGSSQ